MVEIRRGDTIQDVEITKQNANGSIDYLLDELGTYRFSTTVSKRGCTNSKVIQQIEAINTGVTECDLNPRSCINTTHAWSSSACTGQCITDPWWTVAPGGWICLNSATGAPDRPYDTSKCGPVPRYDAFDHSEPVLCPAVCSPWGGTSTM